MKKKITLSILLLVHNEGKTISNEIKKIQKNIIQKIKEVEFIITQDGSNDDSDKIIKSLKKKNKIQYYSFKKKLGVHNALLFSLKKARGEYIFFLDSGNKFFIKDFFKLYKIRDKYDFVSGYRVNRQDQFYRILLTYLFNFFLKFFTKSKFNDLDSGFKLFKKKPIKKCISLKKINSHFFMSELCLKALYMNYSLKEIKISYFQRKSKSRATSLKKIPGMILSFLVNFYKLRMALNAIKNK